MAITAIKQNHAFYLLRVALLGANAQGKKPEDTTYHVLAFTDKYDNKPSLQPSQLVYRERVDVPAAQSSAGPGLRSVTWGSKPAPPLDIPGLDKPGANPFSGSATIRYIYDAALAEKSPTGTLVGFGQVEVKDWKFKHNISAYRVDNVKQPFLEHKDLISVSVRYILTNGPAPTNS